MHVLLLILGYNLFWIQPVMSHNSWALAFELPDNDKMCFYHKWTETKSMVFDFEVIRGGNMDIDVLVESPNGDEIMKEIKQQEGSLDFDTSFGTYSFCFSNEFSTFSHKVIYFELRPEGHDTLAVEAGRKKPTVDTQLEHSMEQIHESSSNIMFLQRNYRVDESRGHNVAEDLNARIQWWSLGQALVIIFVGFGQVLLLKTLFSVKLGHGSSNGATKSIPILLAPCN